MSWDWNWAPWKSEIAEYILIQSPGHCGGNASGIVRGSAHRVKWSMSTSIQVFLLVDNGIGLTRSTATTCHGRLAYSRR